MRNIEHNWEYMTRFNEVLFDENFGILRYDKKFCIIIPKSYEYISKKK